MTSSKIVYLQYCFKVYLHNYFEISKTVTAKNLYNKNLWTFNQNKNELSQIFSGRHYQLPCYWTDLTWSDIVELRFHKINKIEEYCLILPLTSPMTEKKSIYAEFGASQTIAGMRTWNINITKISLRFLVRKSYEIWVDTSSEQHDQLYYKKVDKVIWLYLLLALVYF